MINELIELAESTEQGKLGILHLKRYWTKYWLKRAGNLEADSFREEWNIDTTLLSVLGIGIEQTMRFLYQNNPDFNGFEDWIIKVTDGQFHQNKIAAFNSYIVSGKTNSQKPDAKHNLLTTDDIDFWNKNGYIIIRKASTLEDCENAIEAICNSIDIKRYDASTWYNPHPLKQGIMVQLFQHPALEKNRQSIKILRAYEQLWDRKDIWLNTDRAGFNPPETGTWKFTGPGLHWDVSLELPIPFGLQGILYLSDTAANQGAFTLVPGFQNKIEAWLNNLPADSNPRNEDMYALGAKAIVAKAGDFIIWHQALPHGSSPNTATLPRFVQYINYAPLDAEIREKWK